ncbi:uncharacterized mitochondrial protein AtMg00810-like [Telopea speciosissima]|uniref:uncharacterized mitochondrial protein AtMg00810-like n=1 Tax=Telopea speciosissima TaxID=54955 RepID=UPI001CC5195E|nr:uncharacterized mitochondrial protein AtMg00810-like [Telopea speciosissima]
MHKPTDAHWVAVKRILRYLCHTPTDGLFFTAQNDISVTGYSVADWAGCPLDRKSTTGYCVYLGHHLISWNHINSARLRDLPQRLNTEQLLLLLLKLCGSVDQTADIFTKGLSRQRFSALRSKLTLRLPRPSLRGRVTGIASPTREAPSTAVT